MTNVNDNGHIEAELDYETTDYTVSETVFDPHTEANAVIALLRKEKMCGQAIWHLGNGGVQKIVVIQRTKQDELFPRVGDEENDGEDDEEAATSDSA